MKTIIHIILLTTAFSMRTASPAHAQDLREPEPGAIESIYVPAAPAPADADGMDSSRYEPVPIHFNFTPADLAGYKGVFITICGMDKEAMLHFASGKEELKPMVEELEGPAAKFWNIMGSYSYMEDAFRPDVSAKEYLVLPFPWSRNPLRSRNAIKNFKKWLAMVHEAAQAAGKPVVIASHSWGCLLAYSLMKQLQDEGSPIVVDQMITLGGPFDPRVRWAVFLKLVIAQQGLNTSIAPLGNVKWWTNVYAERDSVSNFSDSGPDANIRIDERADTYEEEIRAQFGGPADKQAHEDLKELRSSDAWHHAPIGGMHLDLKSIDKRLDLDIMGDYLMPLL